MDDKASLRQRLLARRQSLTAEQALLAGEAALQRLMPLLVDRQLVMLYMPFRGELSTLPVANWLQQNRRPLVLPQTNRRLRRITPVQVSGLDQLVSGAYGILEPAPGASQEVSPELLDLVIVPGVGFDPNGYRIGYGGGYYDRFLPRLRADCLTLGYGYDWQIVPEIAADPWDQPLDYLVTDCSCLPIIH